MTFLNGHIGPRSAVLVALVVALLTAAAVPAAAASPEERRVAENRAKIAAIRAQLTPLRATKDVQAVALADAESQFTTVLKAVAAAEQAVQRQEQAVDQARVDLQALELRAAQHRDLMALRAADLYKQGTTGSITALLEAANPRDALRRSAYADIISRSERRVMENVSVSAIAVGAQRTRLLAEEGSLTRVVEGQRLLLADARRIRDERQFTVVSSAQQIAQLEAQEDHLEAENRQVSEIARGGGGVPVPDKVSSGGWAWPARGPVTSGFGSRWGRQHSGIDIGAGSGAPIVASKPGVVSYAGSMSGYGRVVILNHGSGLSSLYAHQSAIAVSKGQRVTQEQRIGSVGCSGHCTGPHLHFEVRQNGVARNPRNYL